MSQSNFSNFVNECRNIVWLSGYARKQEDGSILLYQSANEAAAFPIQVPSKLRLPSANIVVEVKCHAFGRRNPETQRSELRLEAIQIKRAGITAAPRQRTFLNALRDRVSAASNPFAAREEVITEIQANLQIDRDVVAAILSDADKRSGRDGFQNRAVLSGFVGHKAFVPPSDDGSGDLGHVAFTLIQHEDVNRAIPVRVKGADSRFGKELGKLRPTAVIARVSVIAERDGDDIVARHLHLDASRADVGMAMLNDFAAKSWPEWWRNALVAHHNAQREQIAHDQARGEKMQRMAKAEARAPVAAPAPAAVAEAGPSPAEMDFGGTPVQQW